MRTTLEGELGMSTEVEVSAVGDQDDRPHYFSLIVRDVGSRAKPGEDAAAPVTAGRSGATLETAVRTSVEAIERQHLIEALAQSRGKRTAAAKTLGISRQSLHAKLKKYRLPQD